MSANTVEYGAQLTANTNRGPSPSIWKDCRVLDIIENPGYGMHYFEDFLNFRTSTNVNAAEAFWANGLKLFGDNGAAIADADIQGGGIVLSSDGDNEGASIGQMTAPYQISRSHGKLWFEARVKTSTIADTKHGFFLGLIDSSALSATVPIAAAGTLADEDFVGFHRLEGDGDYVDTVYKAGGVTQVSVQTDAQVLVADTWVKLGMVFDPDDVGAANTLSFYGNGVRLATTKVIPSTNGDDFPNDVRLGFVFAVLNATASSPGTSTIDWVRIAQLFV